MSESTDQARIERDLAQTRNRMDERLTELQARLSPGQVLDDVMGYLRGSEGGEFGRNLMDTVRTNPMPAALTGIGLAWLMMSNTARPAEASRSASPSRDNAKSGGKQWLSAADVFRAIAEAETSVVRQEGDTEDAHRDRIDDAKAAALGIARDAADTASSFGTRITEAFEAAKRSVTQSVSDLAAGAADRGRGLSETAGNLAASASDTARQARDGANEMLASMVTSPVLLGAVGLAVGALLGALVPISETERAALGDIAGKARESATDLAKTAMDTGSDAVDKVVGAASDGMKKLELGGTTLGSLADQALSGDLAGKAKELAGSVVEAADKAVRSGLGSADETQPTPAGNLTGSAAPSRV